MLTRVLPVVFGRPEPWMFSWVKKQPLPGFALICQLFPSEGFRHLFHAEAFLNRELDQFP
jgi:hypothetical protein